MVDTPPKTSLEELVVISMTYSMICLEVKEDAVEADSVLFLKIYLVGEVVLVVLVEMIFCMNVILL